MDKRKYGKMAEKLACQFLQKKGLKLCECNFYCNLGEIDLIMQDKEYLVFIEVRKRKKNSHATAIESIDYHKQQRLRLTAEYYLQKKSNPHTALCRFDVIAITDNNGKNSIQWIKNAF